MAPGDVYAAAAVVQHSLTQVRTLFHLLLEQQVSELGQTQQDFRDHLALAYAFGFGRLLKYANVCVDKQKAQKS